MKDSKNRKRVFAFLLLTIIALSLASCMPGPNNQAASDEPEAKPAGFWKGLWHGLIAFISFVVSLFNKNVNVYEVYNNGGWYNFGFILGVMIAFGGGGGAGGRAAKNRNS